MSAQQFALEREVKLTIFAPMIYTAPCIMFWMRAYPLRGEVGRGWALKFSSFLGPVKWHRADPIGDCHFEAGCIPTSMAMEVTEIILAKVSRLCQRIE